MIDNCNKLLIKDVAYNPARHDSSKAPYNDFVKC